MANSYKGWIPRTLNDPPSFLWWDINVALPPIVTVIAGIFSGMPIPAAALTVAYFAAVRKYREKLPKGFIFNLLYGLGFLNLNGYPIYAQRRFWE
ncbi:MAG: type IV conjugative transfer system protein TraL [Desulfovibrio sp.]|jgi:type IV conjugative transfer system protein TraL|nr:type IV conjugative transfer system protein TraL [Desulfovibrio sp.]